MPPSAHAHRASRTLLIAISLGGSISCSRESPTSKAPPDAALLEVATDVDAAIAPAIPSLQESEVRALLTRWTSAQNAGDYDAYAQLYASKFFGIKRAGARETRYAREGWLDDRRRMFQKPLAVEVRDEVIRASTNSAQVELVQRFRAGNFADEGPKRILIVREAGALKIAQEEMVSSRELEAQARTPPPAHGFHFVLPVERGLLWMLDGADAPEGKGKISLLDHRDDVWTTSQPLADDTLDPTVRALLGERVRLDDGCVAEVGGFVAVSRVDPHFGDEQVWSGSDERGPSVPMPLDRQAEAAFALSPRRVAATLRGCEGSRAALFAQPVSTPATVSAESVDDEALVHKARLAFARLADVAAAQRDFLAVVEDATGTWWEPSFEAQIFRHPSSGQTLIAARAVWQGESCADFSASLRAFYVLRSKKLVLLRSEPLAGDLSRVLDVDGDGRLEVLLERVDLGIEHQLLSPHAGGPEGTLGYSYQDCPC